jgi:hypothetical protein
MTLVFSWENMSGRIVPFCTSPDVSKDGISILPCLLMDDGGQRYLDTISWIDNGIAMMDSVIRGEALTMDWGRETWGAKLRSNEVELYSLHDEDYQEKITPAKFRDALVAWRKFLQSTPDTEIKKEIILS